VDPATSRVVTPVGKVREPVLDRTQDTVTGVGGALLRPGQRINSALVVDRRLGEGAFAEVYRVRHHILGWQALKLFKHVASLEATSRMLDEARILSTLGHPNIIRVFDAGTVQTSEGVRGYITMEYVAGGSLERLMESHAGVVPVGEVTAVLRQAAEGLAVAHERPHPIVHRDLSLANVLITYDETGLRVKVSDFGLAKEADPGTMAASAQGTVAYMPPEVVRRGKGYGCPGDVWALGTIVYFLLTGQFPYDGGDPVQSFSLERFTRPLQPPRAFNDDVGTELDRLVTDMLRIDPAERPATARAVADRAAGLRPAPGPEAAGTAEPAESADALVREATAQLYRRNVFAVTGLPTHASGPAVRRHRQKVEARLAVGDSWPGAPEVAPAGGYGKDEVRASFEGLQDPRRRMVDELLWLWGPSDSGCDCAPDVRKGTYCVQGRLLTVSPEPPSAARTHRTSGAGPCSAPVTFGTNP
jgi:tRNA A-37 threonylcarbamoyl transferase component Bud32